MENGHGPYRCPQSWRISQEDQQNHLTQQPQDIGFSHVFPGSTWGLDQITYLMDITGSRANLGRNGHASAGVTDAFPRRWSRYRNGAYHCWVVVNTIVSYSIPIIPSGKLYLVRGWPTPLKNDGVKVSWDDDFQYMEKHVWNHQPDIIYL